MIGRLVDISRGLETDSYRITFETNADVREMYDGLKGKAVNAEFKQYRERRSLDANALAWVMLDKLAEALHKPKTEVYREIIREVGGVSEIVCVQDKAANKLRELWESRGTGWQTETSESRVKGCVNVRLYYGSSAYDTAQMSRFIDLIMQECEQQGIPTDKNEAERTKENWGKE